MALRHTYRERLMDKIRAKAEGEVIVSEARAATGRKRKVS
jgi:hypothetical protein